MNELIVTKNIVIISFHLIVTNNMVTMSSSFMNPRDEETLKLNVKLLLIIKSIFLLIGCFFNKSSKFYHRKSVYYSFNVALTNHPGFNPLNLTYCSLNCHYSCA